MNITTDSLLQIKEAHKVKLTISSFRGVLRNYQIQDIALMILSTNVNGSKGYLIAEPTGSGKTVISIGLLCKLWERKELDRVLVVTEKSILRQWQDDIKRFSGFSSVIVSGSPSRRAKLYRKSKVKNVTILNYALVRKDIDKLLTLGFPIIFFDEASNIRTHDSETTRACAKLAWAAQKVYPLTATPSHNSPLDMHCIMSLFNPSVLGPLKEFKDRFCFYEERAIKRVSKRGGFYWDRFMKLVGYRNLDDFEKLIEPWYIMRSKAEIMPELPPLTIVKRSVEMTPKQKKKYAEAVRGLLIGYNEIRRIDKMTAFTYLQEICDNLAILPDSDSDDSAKMTEVLGLLNGELSSEKVVIYDRFKSNILILNKKLEELGIGHVTIHSGITSADDRDKFKKRFTTDPECRVMTMTSAGLHGMNLQAGSTLITFNLPLTPADLWQLIGRLHRDGQKNPVTVIRLTCDGTIENRVEDILIEKMKTWESSFGDQADILSLFPDPDFVRMLRDKNAEKSDEE